MDSAMVLTTIEHIALRGLEALGREMHTRHAAELRQHGVETLEVLAGIAVAHGLPADAFMTEWGVITEAGIIVRMDGTSPAEVTG